MCILVLTMYHLQEHTHIPCEKHVRNLTPAEGPLLAIAPVPVLLYQYKLVENREVSGDSSRCAPL